MSNTHTALVHNYTESWPEYKCYPTKYHVERNGEEVGYLHVVVHQTHQGFIAVAAVIHDSVVEVALEKPKYVYLWRLSAMQL